MRKRIELSKLTERSQLFLLSRKELERVDRAIPLAIEKRPDGTHAVNEAHHIDVLLTQERLDADATSTVPVFFTSARDALAQYDADQLSVTWAQQPTSE